jgi:hypothetical protein
MADDCIIATAIIVIIVTLLFLLLLFLVYKRESTNHLDALAVPPLSCDYIRRKHAREPQ